MFKNYLKIAIRNLIRYKTYSTINILGLAIGMTSFILISLWVLDELSFDKFHEKIENLYRVVDYEKYSSGEEVYFSQNSALLGPILKKGFPEILDYTRVRGERTYIVNYEEKSFTQEGIIFADPSIFSLFSFDIIKGREETILDSPFSVAITERMAKKYFADDDPIGKIIQIDKRLDFKITGVIKNPPSNSHLQFNFIIPFNTLKHFGFDIDSWRSWAYATYVLLDNNTGLETLNKKIKNVIIDHEKDAIATIELQPITDIHLKSSHIWGLGGEGEMKYIYIFTAIAIFILLTACFNFMNLATARANNRAMEIGLRKVVGAQRKEIIFQFLFESLFISIISILISIFLINLFLPSFNILAQKELKFSIADNYSIITLLLTTALITGLISGLYPALFLSRFQPVRVLKGVFKTGKQGSHFRRVLVVIQFVLTISLIFGTIIINQQMNFIRNQKLGFDKENIISIIIPNSLREKAQFIKTELERNKDIVGISSATTAPNKVGSSRIFKDWEGSDPDEQFLAHFLSTDDNFAALFDLDIEEGRYFSKEYSTDTSSIVINETAARIMGLIDPIGKMVGGSRIIGVLKDYHFQSLHNEIKPQVIYYNAENPSTLLAKLAPGNLSERLNSLKESWNLINPGYPFQFNFIDEYQEQMYKADKKVESIINVFTLLALFIACLGLFGLTSFVAEQRTKEIGVRKVLGASIFDILFLFNGEFVKWILLANIFALPIMYYGMISWLGTFAYRVKINWWFFILAGFIALGISLITASIQSIRASLINPVESLKNE